MKKRVTMRDIAEKAGVHFTTAALALRNDLRLKESTREKVQEVARAMGYEPDPMVNALNFYRQTTRPAHFQGVLAWLSNERQPVLGGDYHFQPFVEGACEQAQKLGYRIEEFPFRLPGMTPERYASILRARGITGILVGPQPVHRMGARVKMDWAPFSAVAIGPTLLWPNLHRISNNHYRSVKLAIHHLVKLGYRRIGFAMERSILNRVDGAWLGGYSAEVTRRSLPGLEPLIFDQLTAASAQEWMKRQRPEAVISLPAVIQDLTQHCRLRIPEDLGSASLHLSSGPVQKDFAGIDQSDHRIGAEAVKLLVSLMHLHERGIPDLPLRLMVDGIWRDGPSVRAQPSGEKSG